MSLSAQLTGLLRTETRAPTTQRLQVELAVGPEDVRAAQRLRYRVFVEETGARLHTGEPGIEADRFDPFCQHLIVRDLDTRQIAGCHRILTDKQAWCAGGYYSQSEFDLTRILSLPGRLMEVGRTCVHPDYRTGAVIGLLWRGLTRFMVMNKFDYLMGCASVPLGRGTDEAAALFNRLSKKYLSSESWRVFPKVPLPRFNLAGATATEPAIPPLIEAYLHAGARICGEPTWDPHFNVADLFILLRADYLPARSARHFPPPAA